MSKMEVQSNNENQQTVETPKLVTITVTADKPDELVDTDNQNVEYTSTKTKQFTDKCQIEVKVSDSSELSDSPAGLEHNLNLTVAPTGSKVLWTFQLASGCNVKETVEEETNFGNKSLDDELYSKYNWNLNKKREKDFESFETNWKKVTDFQIVREQEGDLFEMPNEYSLGRCVAEDFNMGTGIMTLFRAQCSNLGILYSQKQKQGGVAYLKDEERYMYYLVTKRVSSGEPTYLTMWNSLCNLKLRMDEHGVKKLAVPRLGCGFDHLEWAKVKAMIETTFEGIKDVEIVVCNFKQVGEPNVVALVDKCKVFNVAKRLVKLNKYMNLIFLGCEDDTITDTMKSIYEKHPFMYRKYKLCKRTIGTAFAVYLVEYAFYGFIVRKRKNDPLDFVAFERCAEQLNRENENRRYAKHQYYYVAMEALKDPQDDLMLYKLVHILRCVLKNVTIYICWPDELVGSMPREYTD